MTGEQPFFWEKRNAVVRWLGRISYQAAYSLQEDLHTRRILGEIPDTILALEHDPVLTLGKRGNLQDLLIPPEQLAERGIQFVQSDRGGQLTYHGPGQLVLYFIIQLGQRQRHVRAFVDLMEKSIIQWLADEGIQAHSEAENPGVWSAKGKLAALGIRIHQQTTMHGLALNLNPDLDVYKLFIPCGIRTRPISSVHAELHHSPEIKLAARQISERFSTLIGYNHINFENF